MIHIFSIKPFCVFRIFAALLLTAGMRLTAAEKVLVPRQDYRLGATWHTYDFMGRDFHTLLAWGYEESGNLPLYRDCAVTARNYFGNLIFTDPVRPDGTILPDEKVTRSYKLGDMFLQREDMPLRDQLYGRKKLDRPLFVNPPNARPPFYLTGNYTPDQNDYQTWKSAHPNFMGFRFLSEFDSDMRGFASRYPGYSSEVRKRLGNNIRPPRNQYAWGPLIEELISREKKMFFGEERFWTMHSGSYIGHLMAKYGASGFFYEATGQGASRWQIAGAFARGASRQFEIPFGWYVAHWYSGFTRDGKHTEGENNPRGSTYQYNGKDMGLSRTIINRQNWYAWLNGASFLEHENWLWLHFDGTQGKPVPSLYARDLDELNTLSKTLKRGQVYSPIAILTPIFEQYDFLNGHDWMTFGDLCSQNAFFYTLVPVKSDVMQQQLRKQGFQCGFFNTPFAECYDVICPDAGQKPEAFDKALAPYKCAFLIGGYKPEMVDVRGLQHYVRNGGTLFLSAEYIRQGLLPVEMTGLLPAEGVIKAGRCVMDDAGVKIPLNDEYQWEKMSLQGAEILFVDDLGNSAVYRRNYGKGAVVTVACDKMMPLSFKVPRASDEQVRSIVAGRQTFPLIQYFLERAQRECLPVQVIGNIQYGVNQTEKGWLVWLFNNDGVIKYTYEPEQFDDAKSAVVTLKMRDDGKWRFFDPVSGAAFSPSQLTIRPGAVQLVAIEKEK